MIKKGKHLIKSHMTLDYDFTGVRIQDGMISPVDWNLKIALVASGKTTKSKEEIEFNAGIAYQKIYFWLDSNLPNSIVVNVGNEDDLYLANLSSNIMMYCPDNPGDELLIQLLHAKISTLANSNLLIGEMQLSSSDSPLQYTFDCPDTGYALPSTTEEYYTEGKTRDKEPWWFRDDGFCFEFVRPDDNEQSDDEIFKDIIDPMFEFQKIMAEVSDIRISVIKEPAKIVQVEKWKPKKV